MAASPMKNSYDASGRPINIGNKSYYKSNRVKYTALEIEKNLAALWKQPNVTF